MSTLLGKCRLLPESNAVTSRTPTLSRLIILAPANETDPSPLCCRGVQPLNNGRQRSGTSRCRCRTKFLFLLPPRETTLLIWPPCIARHRFSRLVIWRPRKATPSPKISVLRPKSAKNSLAATLSLGTRTPNFPTSPLIKSFFMSIPQVILSLLCTADRQRDNGCWLYLLFVLVYGSQARLIGNFLNPNEKKPKVIRSEGDKSKYGRDMVRLKSTNLCTGFRS